MCTTVLFLVQPGGQIETDPAEGIQAVVAAAGCAAEMRPEHTQPFLGHFPPGIPKLLPAGESRAFILWSPPDSRCFSQSGCSCSIISELQDAVCSGADAEDTALIRVLRGLSRSGIAKRIGLLVCEDIPEHISVHEVQEDEAIELLKAHYGWQSPDALKDWNYDMNALMIWDT